MTTSNSIMGRFFTSRRKIVRWQWLFAVILVLYLLIQQLPDKLLGQFLSVWMQVVSSGLALIVIYQAWASLPTGSRPEIRRFWLLLTIGVGAWLAADLVYAISEWPALADSPVKSLADGMFFITYLSMLAGALLAPVERLVRLRRLKNLLDISIVTFSGLLIFLSVVIHPVLESHDNNLGNSLVDIVFPLLDLPLLVVFSALLFRTRAGEAQTPFILLALGVCALILVDWVSAYAVFHGFLVSEILQGVAWEALSYLAAMAGLAQIRLNLDTAEAKTVPIPPANPLGETWTIYVAYGWLMLDIAIVIWQIAIETELSHLLLVGWVSVVWLLVMFRQSVVLHENRKLLEGFQQLQVELEERVDERTEELRAANQMLLSEINMRSQLQRNLVFQMKLESVMAKISTNFINLEVGRLPEAINQAIGEIGRLIGAQRGYIYLLDETKQSFENAFGVLISSGGPFAGEVGSVSAANMPVMMQNLRLLAPFVLGKNGQALPKESPEESMLQRYQIDSLIATPLAFQNRLIGVLGFDILKPVPGEAPETTVSGWTLPEIDLTAFALFGNALAQALERKRTEEELLMRTRQLEALREISLELTAQLDLNTLLLKVCEWAVRLVEADAGGFFLYDETADLLRMEVKAGALELPPGIIVAAGEGMTGRAFSEKTIQMTNNYPKEPEAIPRYIQYFPGAVISIPVLHAGACLGVLTITTLQARQFTPAELNILTLFAAQASIAMRNAELYERTHNQAITDPLTEVYNRRHFFELAEIEIERAHRYRNPLVVLIMDLDFFKKVNDTHGHLVGDEVLRQLVARCQDTLRDSDLFSRYGGEEFIALLPETDLEAGCAVAERLRHVVEGKPFVVNGLSLSLTISIGVTGLDKETYTMDSLLKKADEALYAAKNNGRNQVVVG